MVCALWRRLWQITKSDMHCLLLWQIPSLNLQANVICWKKNPNKNKTKQNKQTNNLGLQRNIMWYKRNILQKESINIYAGVGQGGLQADFRIIVHRNSYFLFKLSQTIRTPSRIWLVVNNFKLPSRRKKKKKPSIKAARLQTHLICQ